MAEEKHGTPGLQSPDLGDTERPVTGRDHASITIGEESTHEILDAVVRELIQHPQRGDLWMMRFEIQRTLGLRDDFIRAMREGYRNPRYKGNIDWQAVRGMWDELAPDVPPPADVSLPEPMTNSAAERAAATRRFSDLSRQIADPELSRLSKEYQALRAKPDFFKNFARATRMVLQRPRPLQRAAALEREFVSTARIFLKREDLHSSTPEFEMAAAHAYIATAFGKRFIMTGNDVDEFSLALAEVAPKFGLKPTIVLGLLEMDSKASHVARLRALGAQIETNRTGDIKTHDPREAALRLWTSMHRTHHLALSFGTGPNPYPLMVSDFQMLLGYECELQLRAQGGVGTRALVAAVHSEADSIGFMLPYLKRQDVELFYGEPVDAPDRKAWKSSARLRAYGGASREHAWLRATGRITHIPVTNEQALKTQTLLKELEGVSISLEDARAVAVATGLASDAAKDRDIVVLVA